LKSFACAWPEPLMGSQNTTKTYKPKDKHDIR